MRTTCPSYVHGVVLSRIFRNGLKLTSSVLIFRKQQKLFLNGRPLVVVYYNPPYLIVQIEQINHRKIAWRLFNSNIFNARTHVNYITGIMNQRLYLLNEMRKQGVDIKCLTWLFVGPVCGTNRWN